MIENYREMISLGKYGHIRLVVHDTTGKVYVKKRLEVFNREVYERLAELRHRNIPCIVEWDDAEDGFYVIEEYINGETLEEKLDKGHVFSETEAVEIMMQVCDALEFLHWQNPPIIHRDIKLSNIMISNDGVVKLIDYNAARHYEAGSNKDTTLIGTAGYAAPEQFGFSQTDMRADIYAVGVVLNELLTKRHISECVCDGACRKIVKTCVQMDPENRYQNASELKDALRAVSGSSAACMERRADRADSSKKTESFLKIMIVMAGYLAAVFLASRMDMPDAAGDVTLFILEKACLCAHLLFMAALAVNYGGIAGKIPVVKHKRSLIQIAGFVIWWQISRYAAEGIFLIVKTMMAS